MGDERLLRRRSIFGECLCRAAGERLMGYRVVECYPGAAQDIWGIPRQHRDRERLLQELRDLGVKGLPAEMTGDELDAVTAALGGRWFLTGKGEILGGENGIVVPQSARDE